MQIFTIGHGSQPIERFIDLLRQHTIEVLVDTRSQPFSVRYPQFNQHVVAKYLDEAGIKYLALGDRLGGRPRDASLYGADGKPDYRRMAGTPAFREGLAGLMELARGDENVAIMCSESDYKECHRYKLVSRALAIEGAEVLHIMKDGSLEENPAPQLPLQLS